jgi:NAD-dependent deacetylase
VDPEKVWSFYALRFHALAEAVPNDAHRALAELEGRGLVRAVVTQNIDLLHERAGTRELVEVHGSIRTCICRGCGATYQLEQVRHLLDGGSAPRCEVCGTILKPNVVMFGELLPFDAIDRAYAYAREASLLLVVGSTLEVAPVSLLPWETVRAGGSVAIVNLGPTAFDDQAVLKVEGKAGDVLSAVAAELLA